MQLFRSDDNHSAATALRYDSETTRQILARASEIEAQPEAKETLSAMQIETLGSELGLSPEAIRTALGEHNASTSRQRAGFNRSSATLTQKDIKTALVPGLLYALVSGIVTWFFSQSVQTAPVASGIAVALSYILAGTVAFVVPPLLALAYGWRKRDWHAGALVGGWVCLVSAISVALGYGLSFSQTPISGSLNLLLMLTVLAGVILGTVGGYTRRWWDTLPQNADR